MNGPKKWDSGKLLIVFVLIGLACVYIWVLRPSIVGLWRDDTMYLMGAKSLATGQGYQLLAEPGLMPIIKYPPLLSVVLAPLWWIFPHAPQVVLACKIDVIVLGLAAIWVLYRLGRRFYQLSRLEAATVCLLFGSNYIWLRCVTEVLSEPLFLLWVLSLVYYALRLDKQEKSPDAKQMVVLILLSCLAFYTRTIGIAFIAGAAFWMGKRYGRASVYTYLGSCLLICQGWLWWTMAQPGTIEKINGFYVYPENQTYVNEFFFAIIKSRGLWPILQEAASQFPVTALFAASPFLIDMPYLPATPLWFSMGTFMVLIGGFGYIGYRLVSASRVSMVAVCTWFYLALTFCWYSHGQYPRLILCMVPFAYLYLFRLFKQQVEYRLLSQKARQAVWVGFSLLLVGLFWWYPGLSSIPTGETMALNTQQYTWSDYQAAFSVIRRHTKPDDVLWSLYSGMYYLYTDRPVINRDIIPSAEMHIDWLRANQYQQFYDALAATLEKNRVRYILLEPNFNSDMVIEMPEMTSYVLIRSMPQRFQRVYISPHKLVQLYRFTP
jgi:hypothetical protein